MAQASQLSPDLARGLLQLARALLVAARNWTLYPPEHPTVGLSVDRLAAAIRSSSLGAAFTIGITPDTLMIEGAPADAAQTGIAEAAAFLHDRDLIQISFIGEVPPEALHRLLRVLSLDADERRQRGGPARIWATAGHESLILEQIDYGKVLAREAGELAEPAKRDDLWRSIVMSIAAGQATVFDERSQHRLLAIAGSPNDVADLATAATASQCGPDGSPMITSQAATILAAFRHLTSIVSVMAPDRLPDVMNNLATATAQLDPHVVMRLMESEDAPGAGVAVMNGLRSGFDDVKVAQLLATALALNGGASDRLATIFNTIAPDEDRKRRVLTLTRSMLSETDFGKANQFHALWTSAEELLISYNDKPFVSDAYRTALDGIGGRAERLAGTDLPPELPEWMASLGQDNVRRLSVLMLIDLLTIEQDAARAGEIAQDMDALAEDLLMSGAYDDALTVTRALAARASAPGQTGRDACRSALDRLGESMAMRETVALLGDVDEAGWNAIRDVIVVIGVSSVEALKPVMMVEQDSMASKRAEALIVGFGKLAAARLASLVGDARWFVQRNGARMLGRIGGADAVPLLQPLLRQPDPRVAREAVAALAGINDPAAARAIHTVLRAATGEMRRTVIDALVEGRDSRVVPFLVHVLRESEPLGKDHDVVLETLGALSIIAPGNGDDAVPVLAALAQRRAFFGRRKLRALKEASVGALTCLGGSKATAALQEAARSGDRMLRSIVGSKTV